MSWFTKGEVGKEKKGCVEYSSKKQGSGGFTHQEFLIINM